MLTVRELQKWLEHQPGDKEIRFYGPEGQTMDVFEAYGTPGYYHIQLEEKKICVK